MGWKTMDANKTRSINAEIFASFSQFKHHFMSSFFANFVLAKNNKTQTLSSEKLRKTLLNKNAEGWCK